MSAIGVSPITNWRPVGARRSVQVKAEARSGATRASDRPKIRGALDAWRIDHVEIDVTLPAAVDEAADVVKRILAG
jgi:hypothetical protein